MAEAEDIETKMFGMELAQQKKLAGILKTKFTRGEKKAANLLQLWAENLDDADLAQRAAADMARLRTSRDTVLKAYDVLALQDGMPEQLFQDQYQNKDEEMLDKITALEITATQCSRDAREARRQRVQNIGAQVPQEGGGRKWKLEAQYQPKVKLSLEMTQLEISGWKRAWRTFFQFSQLEQAPIGVIRLALTGCLEESLISRVEPSLELCITSKEMLDTLDKEIRLRNPKIVSRFRWMKTCQRGDETFTNFLAREKNLRSSADIQEMTTAMWIAHVQMQGCANEELLKELVKIKEEDLSEDSIKEVATKWELINATKKGLKGDGDKPPVKVRQVKTKSKTNTFGQDKGSCYKCGTAGHWTRECTVKPELLKCSHCSSVGKHNTNDYCKAKQIEWKEKDKIKKNKANQISATEKEEDSPDEEIANAQQVRAQEDLSSSDEEDHCERHFVNQCNASEGNEKCGKGFLKKGWKRFFTMRGGRGFHFPQVGWKRFYKDMEGNRISTERSSWKGGRRSGTWTGPKSLPPISANGRTIKKCRAQQVSGSKLEHSDFSMVQTPPVMIRLSLQKEEDKGWKQNKKTHLQVSMCKPV